MLVLALIRLKSDSPPFDKMNMQTDVMEKSQTPTRLGYGCNPLLRFGFGFVDDDRSAVELYNPLHELGVDHHSSVLLTDQLSYLFDEVSLCEQWCCSV